MTITAQEVRIGDVVRRERSREYTQAPWSGLVVNVERAERPDGTELRRLIVRGERWTEDHHLELTAPIERQLRGFEEFQPEHIPFTLNISKCNHCQALVDCFSEQSHIAWHTGILSKIHSASTAHYDLSGGR